MDSPQIAEILAAPMTGDVEIDGLLQKIRAGDRKSPTFGRLAGLYAERGLHDRAIVTLECMHRESNTRAAVTEALAARMPDRFAMRLAKPIVVRRDQSVIDAFRFLTSGAGFLTLVVTSILAWAPIGIVSLLLENPGWLVAPWLLLCLIAIAIVSKTVFRAADYGPVAVRAPHFFAQLDSDRGASLRDTAALWVLPFVPAFGAYYWQWHVGIALAVLASFWISACVPCMRGFSGKRLAAPGTLGIFRRHSGAGFALVVSCGMMWGASTIIGGFAVAIDLWWALGGTVLFIGMAMALIRLAGTTTNRLHFIAEVDDRVYR